MLTLQRTEARSRLTVVRLVADGRGNLRTEEQYSTVKPVNDCDVCVGTG